MPIREVTKKEYTFDALPPTLQKKTLEKYRHINTEDNPYHQDVLETYLETKCPSWLNIKKDSLMFSGFYSQGDGASFEGDINLFEFIKTKELYNQYPFAWRYATEEKPKITLKRGNSRYYHECTVDADIENYDYPEDEKISSELDSIIKIAQSSARSEMKVVYKMLEEEYESQTSDKAITEALVTNEYWFDEKGEIV